MSTFHRSRSWLFGGFGFEYFEKRPISDGALSDLADGFLREVLPLLSGPAAHGQLTDLKGRNAGDELLAGIGHSSHDEVFRLGGLAPVAQTDSTMGFEPFEVSLLSPFQKFEGTHHIVHQLEQHRAGPLPAWIPLRLLGYVAPIKPAFLRIGLERFKSLLGFASLGYAPQVTDSLLIDCSNSTFAIRLTTERNKTKQPDLFETIPEFRAVAHVVKVALGFDVREDILSALGKS